FMHLPEDDVEKMLAQELEGRTQALDELVASPSIARWPWRKHLRKGRPAVAVVDAVADQKINLLVLGTVARGGIPGLVMGNTAETILDKVTCSVLALKPDGFVSPIAHPNDG
ncbi:MAG: universal stress protein, partial [Acidimicrobiales bacterium]|nr:universal stress protein [Acidimicrobiales bacterium]